MDALHQVARQFRPRVQTFCGAKVQKVFETTKYFCKKNAFFDGIRVFFDSDATGERTGRSATGESRKKPSSLEVERGE